MEDVYIKNFLPYNNYSRPISFFWKTKQCEYTKREYNIILQSMKTTKIFITSVKGEDGQILDFLLNLEDAIEEIDKHILYEKEQGEAKELSIIEISHDADVIDNMKSIDQDGTIHWYNDNNYITAVNDNIFSDNFEKKTIMTCYGIAYEEVEYGASNIFVDEFFSEFENFDDMKSAHSCKGFIN